MSKNTSDNDTGVSDRSDAPPVESFDPWKLSRPDDGITYLYRSAVDGFWRVINDEDMALQEATNYPVGELIDLEELGDYEEAEYGELRALFVGEDRSSEPDLGVAATGYVCQNFRVHPDEEPKMVSAGPGENGRICPKCGRMTGGPDDEIPYGDPPYDKPGNSSPGSDRS